MGLAPSVTYVDIVNKTGTMKKTITLPDGTTATGEALRVEASTEPWNDLTIEDGAVIRFKAVVSEVVRLHDEKDPDGNPVYHLKIHNVISLYNPGNQ